MKKTFTQSFLAAIIFLLGNIISTKTLAQVPANDSCAYASLLSSSTTCVNTLGTLTNATSTIAVNSLCGLRTSMDVWYKFVAKTAYPVITLSSIGTDFAAAGPRMQLISGSCGVFSVLACSSTPVITTSVSPGGAGLTVGATYYIRVHSNNATTVGTNWGFAICVTDLADSKIETSRSYINITKGINGGSVDVGDTLEIRSTLVIKTNSADSLGFLDTLYNTKGFRLVPGSICLRTNEGKIYKSFTDLYDGDAGHRYTAGLDTVIRINMGAGATTVSRGKLSSVSKPSFYGSSCIIMATYRVVVYASYGTKINFRTGRISYRDVATGVLKNNTFSPDSIIVYKNPGLCPNSISVANAIGVENNGTFGSPLTGTPLARNRGTSAYTNYIYSPFITGGGPQDYYYAVPNNTSATYSTSNTWAKPNGTYRVFGMWDIIGDHTGASNPLKGNPACDTTQPVSPTNPCGYMLVINSAYRTDTAFQYTMTNLCPSTYYEISAWVRNICSKCGCDSNGVSAVGGTYIPFGPKDSSGVQPNIAFDVNGTDYYTTGNIPYFGLASTGTDTANKWVKKGFMYVTGPAETSFTLTIRNNAPGGGGNDWAMDDISVVTCIPDMKYSPSTTPVICIGNSITIADTVRSFYNAYSNYKWQRSVNGGVSWFDIVGTSGVGTPVWNGTSYQYVCSYTIPPVNTLLANTGDKYRVVVGTTSSNITNSNCNFTDGVAIITLDVLDCIPLAVSLLSFNGTLVNNKAHLNWSTSKENDPVKFDIQRSSDGVNYITVGSVTGNNNSAKLTNQYNYTDTAYINQKTFYRIVLECGGQKAYSRIIELKGEAGEFSITNLVNPIVDKVLFDLTLADAGSISVTILDAAGHALRKQDLTQPAGISKINLPEMGSLSNGVYIMQVQHDDKIITKKLVKK